MEAVNLALFPLIWYTYIASGGCEGTSSISRMGPARLVRYSHNSRRWALCPAFVIFFAYVIGPSLSVRAGGPFAPSPPCAALRFCAALAPLPRSWPPGRHRSRVCRYVAQALVSRPISVTDCRAHPARRQLVREGIQHGHSLR